MSFDGTPEGWTSKKLAEVAVFFNQHRVPLAASERAKRPGLYPYWGAGGPIDSLDGFLFDQPHVLVAEDGNTVVKADGRATVHWASGQYWVNNHAHVLGAAEGNDLRWLYYALSDAVVAPFVTGSAQPKLSMGNLSQLPLWRPPLEEQRRIAGVLGALDAKIQANRDLEQRLMETAELLFGRVCEQARLSGVAPTPASELIEVNPKVPISKGTLTPFQEMAATDAWAVRPAVLGERPFSGGCKFEPADTLIAKITGCIEHGKGAFADFIDGPAAGSTEFLVLRAKERLTPEAVFLLSRWPSVRAHLIKRMVGSSGRQRVPADAFDSLMLVVPPDLDSWEGEAEALRRSFKRTHEAWREQHHLRTTRDTLRHKLVSGKLRVAQDYLADVEEPVAV